MTDRRDLIARDDEDFDSTESPNALLWFLVVQHPNISPAIRVVSDVFDYVIDGETYTSVPFNVRTLTDSDQTPSTEITVQNIDRRITEALNGDMDGQRAIVSAFAISSADFDLTVEPRVALGTPSKVYSFQMFELADVRGDVIELTGRVTLIDFAQEPWPFIRATKDIFPGLFFS